MDNTIQISLEQIKKYETEIEMIKSYIKRTGIPANQQDDSVKWAVVNRANKVEELKKYVNDYQDGLTREIIQMEVK